jgi:hypothetical protein
LIRSIQANADAPAFFQEGKVGSLHACRLSSTYRAVLIVWKIKKFMDYVWSHTEVLGLKAHSETVMQGEEIRK